MTTEYPKLFLTPKEVEYDGDFIYLYLRGLKKHNYHELGSTTKVIKQLYRRVYLRDCVYPYVYVMDGLEDVFHKLYFNKNLREIKL